MTSEGKSENDEHASLRRGMDDLVVDTTSVSWVDGVGGHLFYRGINIAELAAHATFEETGYLLLRGCLPTQPSLDAFCFRLREMSEISEKILRLIQELPRTSRPLSILQTALAACSAVHTEEFSESGDSLIESSMRAIAQTPVILAAAYRHHLGVPILAPRAGLTFAENFLYMLSGQVPSKLQARNMEIALILQMDHGFNSSTFTARAVASTLADVYAATSAAVGALAGALHGGASERVMDMIEAARAAKNVEAYIDELLANSQKVMGMGHRVYRNADPRARILQDLVERGSESDPPLSDVSILKRIENHARAVFETEQKPIYVNVDFWSGALYRKLGLLPIIYPGVFAAARVVGWCAHILELRQDNRLYRPKSQYVGPLDVPYIPLLQRSAAPKGRQGAT